MVDSISSAYSLASDIEKEEEEEKKEKKLPLT